MCVYTNKSRKEIVLDVISREGGDKYTNHPADRGGPTKFGVTAGALGRHLNLPGPASAAQVSAMTQVDAVNIYINDYWNKYGLDMVNAENNAVAEFLMDWIVNSSARNAIRIFQKVIGSYADGFIGPNTILSLKKFLKDKGDVKALNEIIDARMEYIMKLVRNSPNQSTFLLGWWRRINSFRPHNRAKR